jgi:hypothetical protein
MLSPSCGYDDFSGAVLVSAMGIKIWKVWHYIHFLQMCDLDLSPPYFFSWCQEQLLLVGGLNSTNPLHWSVNKCSRMISHMIIFCLDLILDFQIKRKPSSPTSIYIQESFFICLKDWIKFLWH